MKENILREAIKLFLRNGFRRTTIEDVTNAVHITKGAFYWHFKSKDELLLEYIQKYDEEFLEQLYAHIGGFEGDFIKKFREYHKYINEFARDHGEFCVLFVTLAAEMAGGRTEAERKIKAVYKKYHSFIESLLGSGKNEGFFAASYDVSLNAHIIIAFHSGILLQWYMNRRDIQGASLARQYRDVILYGMVERGNATLSQTVHPKEK